MPTLLAKTAAEIRERFGVDVIEIVGDVSRPEVQKALLAACPEPDILVNNNGGPPFRDFRELDREKILEGVTQNMVTPIELVQAVLDGMAERGFGRIVNITSLSVYVPIPGLDLSSGARAGLTSFLAGVARTVARPQRHHQQPAARQARHRPPARPARGRLGRGPGGSRRSARPASAPTCRPSGLARRRNSARSAPSSARSMPAT